MTLMGTNVLAVLDLIGRLPSMGERGRGEQPTLLIYCIHPAPSASFVIHRANNLQTQRWSSSCQSRKPGRTATRFTHAVPHPPLRTGHSLPALHAQKLKFTLKNLVLRELRRDKQEASQKKAGKGSGITQKELKII